MKNLNLKTSSSHTCEIIFSSQVDDVFSYIQKQGLSYGSLYIITEERLKCMQPSADLISTLESKGAKVTFFSFSEKTKTIDSALELCERMAEAKLERNNSLVLAIGGGNATDLVGFTASIYRRGLRFAYIPTTLLAQVDASIGGKTAVNYKNYKNVLGTFSQPEFVFICPALLHSLEMKEFKAGMAEMLKAFIIEDNGNYNKAVELMKRIKSSNDFIPYMPKLEELIYEAVKVKVNIVAKDEREKGKRIKLNLGHTFAHSIEHLASLKGDDITHGDAVSMGIVLAARLSDAIAKQEGKALNLAEKITSDFQELGLPTVCNYELSELKNAMEEDKKRLNNKNQFVLFDGIGKVYSKSMEINDVLELLKNVDEVIELI